MQNHHNEVYVKEECGMFGTLKISASARCRGLHLLAVSSHDLHLHSMEETVQKSTSTSPSCDRLEHFLGKRHRAHRRHNNYRGFNGVIAREGRNHQPRGALSLSLTIHSGTQGFDGRIKFIATLISETGQSMSIKCILA
ncbi:hypothetical protein SCP_0413020 [Sparassis crispa]|uniref:Uncharacterized protein n=1 Tax=Sparassis crispa TaxID=139825 RepID=A0A401GL73_9APHY|nr:hypothetical protein SCP_0413020 [Sparassis crispa]GBE82915.1 hypothetical protein SCP_0413020 [Sparassis crispa]